MNSINQRLKNEKKGITPVIATIILIAGTLVLALVVGAYTFGIFGSNVKNITMQASTSLNGGTFSAVAKQGTASLDLYLQNPGSATTITAITITGGGLSSAPAADVCSSPTACGTVFSATTPAVPSGGVQFNTPTTSFYFENPGNGTISTGNTYQYTILFANGQSMSGSLIAQ